MFIGVASVASGGNRHSLNTRRRLSTWQAGQGQETRSSRSGRARRENARTHRELLALLDDTMKLDKDPSEQEEQLRRKRSSRKNKEQRGAARAATIAFDSDEWDEMVGAGWSVKDSSSLLVGAGYNYFGRSEPTGRWRCHSMR